MHSVSAAAPGSQRRRIRCSLTTTYTSALPPTRHREHLQPTHTAHLFVRQLQRLDTFKESRIRARDLYGRLGARHRHPELSFHLLPEHAALAPALTHCALTTACVRGGQRRPSSPTASSSRRSRSCSAPRTPAVSRAGSSTRRALPSAPSPSAPPLMTSGRGPPFTTSRVRRAGGPHVAVASLPPL